jgi:3-aminoavenalumate diazotase
MYLFGTHHSIAQRLRLTARRRLGAGNFFWHACDVADLDRPAIFRLDGTDVRALTLRELRDRVDTYANWYHANGVKHGTRVGIYTEDGLLGLLHHIAVTSLGGVSVIANPRMAPDVAEGYFAAAEATMLAADESRLRKMSELANLETVDITTVHRADAGEGDPPPRPYRHADDDLIMISHSSGTTGVPKPTTFTHRGFFVGKRERLWKFPSMRSDRLLTALPQSHSAGISYVSLAMMLGLPTMMLDDASGGSVAAGMNAFLPTTVVGFPISLADLDVADLSEEAKQTVHTWMGMGDASHQRHILPLVRIGRAADGSGPGSTYLDGLGSSEMGMVLFRQAYRAGSESYDRAIGKPVPVVRKAAVLDPQGNELPDGEAGLLGVRTPSVTPGYVNNEELNEQSRRGGYFLTGDVVRHENGTWYHLDRTPDVIVTEDGPVYSLLTEEVVLKETQAFDAAVVAVDDQKAPEFSRPVAVVLFKDEALTAAEALARCNAALAERGMARLEALVVAANRDELPVGVTGKVLKRVLRERHRTVLGGDPGPGVAIASSPVEAT